MVKSKQNLTPTAARGGSSRRMNLRVLTGSLALMLVAAVIFYVNWNPPPQGATPPQQQGELR
jgi:hypothetical protein